MNKKIFLDITVRRKSPIEVALLFAAVCGLSLVVGLQKKRIMELESGAVYGTTY